jgi:hypothetical protein
VSYYEKRYLGDDDRIKTGNVVHDIIKYGLILLLIVGVLGGLATYTGLAARWFAQPAQILSPENVRAQWAFAYTYEESLAASARQVCVAEAAVKAATTDAEGSARRSQLFAIQQNYARIEGEYNAKLRNAFEAKLVRPDDVPTIAPTLAQMRVRVGC